ncbi:hypothetical protein [Fodinicola acaciae]|uniref:hypothetical protein n=1 Tax=Fodinicola acaciae TaxID=2681555 RepID=UPI00165256F9|nr:hypothetical protein [Fodinicola acaciae]
MENQLRQPPIIIIVLRRRCFLLDPIRDHLAQLFDILRVARPRQPRQRPIKTLTIRPTRRHHRHRLHDLPHMPRSDPNLSQSNSGGRQLRISETRAAGSALTGQPRDLHQPPAITKRLTGQLLHQLRRLPRQVSIRGRDTLSDSASTRLIASPIVERMFPRYHPANTDSKSIFGSPPRKVDGLWASASSSNRSSTPAKVSSPWNTTAMNPDGLYASGHLLLTTGFSRTSRSKRA